MRLFFLSIITLMLACKSGPSDEQLSQEISGKLSSGVTAVVNKGVATLSGTCPDESCKTSSQSAAEGTKGVKSVVNNIVVAQAAPAPTVDVTANDPLQASLTSLLSAYKGVEGKVENGVVTLTGEIKRSQLRPLMQSVNELKPKKVENKLVIK